MNKKKEWSDRLIIESRYHTHNYFVTVTYSPENLPEDLSVSKGTTQKWIKRLSYFCGHTPVHFGCAEYGDESARPHYHLIVFGDRDLFNEILQSWDYGRVDIEPLTPGRCKYVSGYVVKKMTKEDDPRLYGRNPEFWFGSRRPAIGYRMWRDLLEKFATDEQFRNQFLSHIYPPNSIKIGGKWIRLPRYIRDKLKPLFKLYNEEKQTAFRERKKATDWAILKQIAKNLQTVSLKWSDLKFQTYSERKARENNLIKAYELRKRRIL